MRMQVGRTRAINSVFGQRLRKRCAFNERQASRFQASIVDSVLLQGRSEVDAG